MTLQELQQRQEELKEELEAVRVVYYAKSNNIQTEEDVQEFKALKTEFNRISDELSEIKKTIANQS
jgi:hypothetical protein